MSDNSHSLVNQLSRHWWMLGLRGLAAVIFGVLAFVWPGMTLVSLVFLFGAFALVNGVLALVHAFSAPKGYPRFGGLIFEGLVSIAAGILAFIWPGLTALALLVLIAAWAIATGVTEIALAIKLRKVLTGEWRLVLAGILSLIFGVLILIQPTAGALAVVWWIGAFALLFGILLIALAFRVRRWGSFTAPAAGSAV